MFKQHMMDSLHLNHDHVVSLYYAAAVVVGTIVLIGLALFLSWAFVPVDPETQILGFTVI